MLEITYAANDRETAEALRNDFVESGAEFTQDFLLVLVSTESNADITVYRAITKAKDRNHIIIPIVTHPAVLPESLEGYAAVDFTENYQFPFLLNYMKRLDGQGSKRRNRLYLAILVFIVAIMAGLSIWGINNNVFLFPADEVTQLANEADATRDTIIRPTLQVFEPRTTDDAVNFQSTIDAMGPRLKGFVVATATAKAEQASE